MLQRDGMALVPHLSDFAAQGFQLPPELAGTSPEAPTPQDYNTANNLSPPFGGDFRKTRHLMPLLTLTTL